tara:strand:+ start:9021 stop:9932 length:912 start_codon:yes stop_codon:yes gene_type:complete
MPVNYILREDLDELKYDDCIEKSKQSNLFGYSWYLDIVCDYWDVLVLNDYEAVMPIPWKKKYFIKYVYHPLWVLQLGIFSKSKKSHELEFINTLRKRFKFVELRLNKKNSIEKGGSKSIVNQMQYLSLENSYEDIFRNFNRNRKRELKKASKACLKEEWGDKVENLITLFEKNIGIRIKKITKNDYKILLRLMTTIVSKKRGELVSIYSDDHQLVASGFFLFYKQTVTELICATDIKNRGNGANTFLIDRALYRYQKKYNLFDFGGSSMKTIANYYKSFGANTYQYLFFKLNRLPLIVRLFKS